MFFCCNKLASVVSFILEGSIPNSTASNLTFLETCERNFLLRWFAISEPVLSVEEEESSDWKSFSLTS